MRSNFTCLLCQNLEIVKRKFRAEKVTFCGFVRYRELILIFLWFVEGVRNSDSVKVFYKVHYPQNSSKIYSH